MSTNAPNAVKQILFGRSQLTFKISRATFNWIDGLTCNEDVRGSNPLPGSNKIIKC